MNTTTLLLGDCLERMKELEDESINCCVTSPPYFGLRDYGTATWDGGDENCNHSVGGQVQDTKAPGAITTGQRPGVDSSVCKKCGAIRIDQQIGLEPTPEKFTAKIVDVFREVKRVLRSDGTLWLNLGDSYAGYHGNSKSNGELPSSSKGKSHYNENERTTTVRTGCLKPKDLIGIPWRVAFALQQDGWYLRQDIIWHKPNPMPESVTDRCTKSHEYIFLLSKSERYYFDQKAVMEPVANSTVARLSQSTLDQQDGSSRVPGKTNGNMKAVGGVEVRNRRSVWTVNTKPYKGAHFATFPPDLIRPCILAGCPKDGMVLDPFGGSGTTAQVALEEKRNATICELNPEYGELALERIRKTQDRLESSNPFNL